MLCAVFNKSWKPNPTKKNWLLTSNLTNHLNKMSKICWALLKNQGQTHNCHSLIDSNIQTHQCWLTSKILYTLTSYKHWLPSCKLTKSSDWQGWMVSECQKNLCYQHALMVMRIINSSLAEWYRAWKQFQYK